jgi:uncharacterized protein (UPF0335 family)
MGGWGGFLGKIADQFQGRVERLKNEKAKLEEEKRNLEGGSWDAKKAARIVVIDKRIAELSRLLENKASDN